MATRQLQTAAEVMDALGGNTGVSKLTGGSASRVSNWRVFGRFPPSFYFLMTEELAAKGYRAPASLWGMALERAS